eukprot:5598353-Pyramimonas_sp.AAC.1
MVAAEVLAGLQLQAKKYIVAPTWSSPRKTSSPRCATSSRPPTPHGQTSRSSPWPDTSAFSSAQARR